MFHSRYTILSAGALLLGAAVEAIPPPELFTDAPSSGSASSQTSTSATSVITGTAAAGTAAAGTTTDNSAFPQFTLGPFPSGVFESGHFPSDRYPTGVSLSDVLPTQTVTKGIFPPPGVFPSGVFPTGSGGRILYPTGSGAAFPTDSLDYFKAPGVPEVFPTASASKGVEENWAPRRRSEYHLPCWTGFLTPPWCNNGEKSNEEGSPTQSAETTTYTNFFDALHDLFAPTPVPTAPTSAPTSSQTDISIPINGQQPTIGTPVLPGPSETVQPVNDLNDPIYTGAEIPIFTGTQVAVAPSDTAKPAPENLGAGAPINAPLVESFVPQIIPEPVTTSSVVQAPNPAVTEPPQPNVPENPENIPQPPAPVK
ncbi:hypothetical protein BU24DRAFT_426362 [Aaosphaeria arxii CBS 175.79]|uniref:Uncharacterized protein n=1 Tax=Aaosphaeria arxii CBS 175.79 TaxID=1450172 RepID=A0A6A5XFY6_9PLEO|nr:uncharacterized protein BU24DRAFT_426362 [Aaosphaeria arxii CBS 175.79]KAF2011284.1 hypothetical protein BU24DRAFT_426362 [Aaosphaeria arxii CBS 175.79]